MFYPISPIFSHFDSAGGGWDGIGCSIHFRVGVQYTFAAGGHKKIFGAV